MEWANDDSHKRAHARTGGSGNSINLGKAIVLAQPKIRTSWSEGCTEEEGLVEAGTGGWQPRKLLSSEQA